MKNLIIRPQGIGDIILLIPALRSLTKNYPEDEFVLLCYKGFGLVLPPDLRIRTIEIPQHAGIIDTIKLIKKIRREKFDRVFDLFGNPRTAIITLLSGIKEKCGFNYRYRSIAYNHKFQLEHIHQTILYCHFFKHFGLKCEYCPPEVKMPEDITVIAKAAIPEEFINLKPFIAFNPNASYETKAWPEEYVVDFINTWYEKTKIPIMLTFGSPKEEIISRKILGKVGKEKAFIHNKLKLNEFVALLSLVDLFITNDTGPMHMAWSVGTPVIALFGPTTETDVEPLGEKNITLIAKDVDCIRCHKEHCKTKKCMYAITPQMVLEAVEEKLSIRI